MKKKLSTIFLALAVLLVTIAVVDCGGNVDIKRRRWLLC